MFSFICCGEPTYWPKGNCVFSESNAVTDTRVRLHLNATICGTGSVNSLVVSGCHCFFIFTMPINTGS